MLIDNHPLLESVSPTPHPKFNSSPPKTWCLEVLFLGPGFSPTCWGPGMREKMTLVDSYWHPAERKALNLTSEDILVSLDGVFSLRKKIPSTGL